MWRKISSERPELVVFEMTDQYPEIQEHLQLTLMGLGILKGASGKSDEAERVGSNETFGFHK